ncbi:WD repeat-containing protein 88-like [Physella acuta]|uniref:WD repeat-containing protein 88-like n=1 Tax=Physella acuta TaxID=109671 RepID=UPI0027DE5A2D|nr:WD repeat-containing protein 88-like [Physella acuta]
MPAAAIKSENSIVHEKWDNEDLAKVRIKVLKDHTDSVTSCQYIQESQKAASASTDCSVKLWNLKTGECIKTYEDLHTVNISQTHFMLDGSKFLTCGWDKALKFSDAETGKCLLQKCHEDFLTCCQLSHDGKLMAVGSDMSCSLKIYDVDSGALIHNLENFHKSSITSVKFAPDDDKIITTSSDRTAKFYDLLTGTTTLNLEGHTNIVSSCDISHDERNFATASWDKTILLWDVATGMYRSKGPTMLKGGHDGSVSCCQFSSDGLLLVTGSYDMNIVVWDLENSVQKLKLQGHSDWVNDVCFSEDQKWLLSCSRDTTLRLWNIEESDQIPMVMENKKTVNIKVAKCSKCGKPFSLSQLESFQDVTRCVFCRLAKPDKSWLGFSDSSNTSS